jgi:hypothetical protein
VLRWITLRWFTVSVWAGLLAACTPRPEPNAWTGEIASYVVNHGDRTEIVHRLREPGSDTPRPLLVPDEVRLGPGMRVRIWGAVEGDAIRIHRHELLPEEADSLASLPSLTSTPSALVTGMKKPTRRWAFVLVDVDGGGNKIDKVKAQDVLFSPDRADSIRSYFREVSYGLQDLEGEVFGPFPYAMNGRCDTDAVAKALLPQVPGKFDQYLWFFGTLQKACSWGGIAELGKAEKPTRHSWYNAVSFCNVLVQEPGHNFGMVHSSAMQCTLAGQPVPIAWPEQTGQICSNDEYGNVFDPMGGGDCYHMNGVQKAYQDWLAGCNIVKATTSGTFTIYPLESACDGPQLLQIPFPKPRAFGKAGILTGYYLELRAPLGYRDRKLDAQVLVVVGNDVREAKFTGNRNWLLDMKPQTPEVGDGALVVGQRFEDALPGGPKFTLLSVDSTKAVIKVEIADSTADANLPGKGVCSDMTAFTAPGPSNCVTPPTPALPPPNMTPADAGAPAAADAGGGGVVNPPAGGPDADAPGNSGNSGSGGDPRSGGLGASGGSGGSKAGSPTAGATGNASGDTDRAAGGGCQVARAGHTAVGVPGALLVLLGLGWTRRRARRAGHALIRTP